MVRFTLAVALGLMPVVLAGQVLASPMGQEGLAQGGDDLFKRVMDALSALAHRIGQAVVELLRMAFPGLSVPEGLVDWIGFLTLLTALLVLVEVTKRLVWYLVVAGWLIVLIRLGVEVAHTLS